MRCIGRETQNAADAGALAAAAYINGGESTVDSKAATFVAKHSAGAAKLSVKNSDVEIGTWTGTAWKADPSGKYVKVTVSANPHSLIAKVFGVNTLSAKRSAVATLRAPAMCGLVAYSNFTQLNGSAEIDAYDSTATVLASPIFNQVAGVCTNNSTVTASGNISIYGDLLAGPGGTASKSGSASVTGSLGALPVPLVKPVVTKPGSSKALPSADVKVATILTPGVYYLNADLSVNANGGFTLTGATDIYIDGDVTINAKGVVNTTLDPTLLDFYVIGARNVTINGSGKFYGSLIAPDSHVQINGNADFYGKVLANTVHANGNLTFHQDNAVVGETTPATAALVL